MAKPFGEGLKYFRIHISIIDSTKMELMEDEHGDTGFTFIVKLWAYLYRDGYYIELDDEIIGTFCKKVLRKPIAEFDILLKSAIKYRIFDKVCYEQYNVLTSDRIQSEYLDITKRWRRVKMIEDYIIKSVDIDPYHIFLCDRNGRMKFEKFPAEIPGSKKKSSESQKAAIKAPTLPLDDQPPIQLESSTKLMVPPAEIMRICSLVWEDQNDDFKKLIPEKWFKSYVTFNKLIDNEYAAIRTSNYQLSPVDYIKLCKEPINGKKPTEDEINGAIRKLAGNGVNLNFNIYFKLIDYIGYYRENSGTNSNQDSSAKNSYKIDHSELLAEHGAKQ